MKENTKQQEDLFKLALFEQQIQNIQEQTSAVERAIVDLKSLTLGIEELIGKKGEEIMASIGKGIFAKAKLLSEDLLVDVGDKNLVKKNIPETKKLIENQIKKLEDIKRELSENLEKINKELTKIFTETQKQESRKKARQ